VTASAIAFAAGALACVGVADIAGGLAPSRMLRSTVDTWARAGIDGRDPEHGERFRLLATAAAVGIAAGALLAGLAGAFLAAVVAPTAAARILRARRERYGRAVEAGAAAIAICLADALAGGHSLRGAIRVAAGSLDGPPGRELGRVASQLGLGAPTDVALEAMRQRTRAGAIDVIVAGLLLQRRAGGDLVRMLRNSARALEDEQRLLGDVRAATAQARFTGLVVVLLPLGGALLAELASPGFALRLLASPLSAWLIGMALAMQVGAAFAIRRLARLRV
jgi:tight adherence protein B